MRRSCGLSAILFLLVQAATAEETLVQATIHNASIKVLDQADPKIPLYSVAFDATLRNTSTETVFIGPSSAFLVRVDRKVDSEWKTILTSSWYETDGANISKCTSVRPRRTVEYRHLTAMVAFDVSSNPPNSLVHLKFYFQSVCQRGSERPRQVFVTEPKEFVLP